MNTSTNSHLLSTPPSLINSKIFLVCKKFLINQISAVEIETEIFGEEVDSFKNLCNLLCMHSFVPVENKLGEQKGEREGEASSANKLDLQKD
jgi:hypothetical protein